MQTVKDNNGHLVMEGSVIRWVQDGKIAVVQLGKRWPMDNDDYYKKGDDYLFTITGSNSVNRLVKPKNEYSGGFVLCRQ